MLEPDLDGATPSLATQRSVGIGTQAVAAMGSVREERISLSVFCDLATPRCPPMSRTPGGRDMTKRLPILVLVAAASFVVIWLAAWFVLGADLHSKKADATASTAVPSTVLPPEP